MDTAATCDFEYTLERVLYMAIELDNNRWKLGFTVGFGQRPRERNVRARDTMALEWEIQSAKRRFHLPENSREHSGGFGDKMYRKHVWIS